MTPQRVILATEAATLTVAVYGDIAGRNGKMPRPRAIVAALFLYGVLGWVAEFGQQAGRVAAAVGTALFLTTLVGTGAAGSGSANQVIGLLRSFTSHIVGSSQQPQQQGGTS